MSSKRAAAPDVGDLPAHKKAPPMILTILRENTNLLRFVGELGRTGPMPETARSEQSQIASSTHWLGS